MEGTGPRELNLNEREHVHMSNKEMRNPVKILRKIRWRIQAD